MQGSYAVRPKLLICHIWLSISAFSVTLNEGSFKHSMLSNATLSEQRQLLPAVYPWCYGLNSVPLNPYVDALTPGGTVFGDRTYKE